MTEKNTIQDAREARPGTGNGAAPVVPPKVEAVVVTAFAFLGFAGAVALYYFRAAPILISIFLGAGVAALVYGFLGGVSQANLVLGSLKVGGALAALLGVAFFVDPRLQQETRPPVDGSYEWQWAGAGWIGTITVPKEGPPEIKMSQFLNCSGQTIEKPLLKMAGKGTVNGDSSGTKLVVNFPVTFIRYDANCNGTDESYTTVVSGTLERTTAFAGRITYMNPNANEDAPPKGDMILVKYVSY